MEYHHLNREGEQDRDTAAMVAGLRRALADSGLSQAAFARALGTSPSRLSTYLSGRTIPAATFYLRAARIGAGLRTATRSGWMTPMRTTAAVRAALADGDRTWALRMMLQARDHLREMMRRDPEVASASWDAVPNPTGSAAWDALLAALVAREFESQQRPSPAWTRRVDQPEDPWLLHNPFFDDAEVRAQTPDWLASRGIYLAARDLVTA